MVLHWFLMLIREHSWLKLKGLENPMGRSSCWVFIVQKHWKAMITSSAAAHRQIPPASTGLPEFICPVGGWVLNSMTPCWLNLPSQTGKPIWRVLKNTLFIMSTLMIWSFFILLAVLCDDEAVRNYSDTAYAVRHVSIAFKSHEKAVHWPFSV